MEAKALFIQKMGELHEALYSSDQYKMLNSSAILRQLLLDESPLIHIVNKTYKIKLVFKVRKNDFLEFPENVPKPSIRVINPRLSIQGEEYINLNKFLSFKVAIVDNQPFTIREIIKFVANVLGGVHFDSAKDKEELLRKLQELHIFSDVNLLFNLIRNIGLIVLDGLRELKYAVLGITNFEGKSGLSIHMCITLYPIDYDDIKYILDIGVDKDRNRFSLFIDSTEHLNIRCIDSLGRKVTLQVIDSSYLYNRLNYINVEIGKSEHELMLRIDAEGWDFIQKYLLTDLDFESSINFVIGSDVMGDARTDMYIYEYVLYERCLNKDERENVKMYFQDKINNGSYINGLHLKSDNENFLYPQYHPNFINKKQNE